MKVLVTGSLLALAAPALAQTMRTSPPGYLSTEGEREASWGVHLYANGHYQINDGELVGKKGSLSQLDFRLDDRTHRSDYCGRSWTNVTLTLSDGPGLTAFSTTWTRNQLGTPSVVFSGAKSFPTVSGNPPGSPEPWGGPKGEFAFPFKTPYTYAGKDPLLQDWQMRGGKLANSAPWWRDSWMLEYYLDGADHGNMTCGSSDGYRPPGRNPNCADSAFKGVTYDATTFFAWCNYDKSFQTTALQGKSWIYSFSSFTAPQGAGVIHVWGLPQANTSGVSVAAKCHNLHVDLRLPAVFWHGTTSNFSADSGRLPGPNGLRIPMFTKAAGLKVAVQGAWTDSKTREFALTRASISRLPPAPRFQMKNYLYYWDNSSANGWSQQSYALWPITRYQM